MIPQGVAFTEDSTHDHDVNAGYHPPSSAIAQMGQLSLSELMKAFRESHLKLEPFDRALQFLDINGPSDLEVIVPLAKQLEEQFLKKFEIQKGFGLSRLSEGQRDILNSLNRLLNHPETSDVVIDVGGVEFYGHKALLHRSSTLKAKIGKAEETRGEKASPAHKIVIDILECSPDVFAELLSYIYMGQIKLNNHNVAAIYQASMMFALDTAERLQRLCLAYQEKNLSPTHALTLLIKAYSYEENPCYSHVLKYVVGNARAVLKGPAIKELSLELFINILENDWLNMTEIEIIDLAVEWLNGQETQHQEDLKRIKRCIRWPRELGLWDFWEKIHQIRVWNQELFTAEDYFDLELRGQTTLPRYLGNVWINEKCQKELDLDIYPLGDDETLIYWAFGLQGIEEVEVSSPFTVGDVSWYLSLTKIQSKYCLTLHLHPSNEKQAKFKVSFDLNVINQDVYRTQKYVGEVQLFSLTPRTSQKTMILSSWRLFLDKTSLDLEKLKEEGFIYGEKMLLQVRIKQIKSFN